MSTNALTVADAGFSQEQIDIIKSQVAPKGTTNDELAMFLMYCQRTGLDPFARQIYLSERRSKNQQTNQWDVKRVPETTIDGFRLIAERSRQYAGQLGPFWCGDDGEWKDVWIPQAPPVAAKVGILRHDFKEPLWAVALYDEYVQTKSDGAPNSMWKKMPANQLAKCAESLGHRKAFPRELSGLYTREEMPDPKEEGKEAQRDYLADKGLEPYVAPKKEIAANPARCCEGGNFGEAHECRKSSPTSPETIRQLSEVLDQPPAIKTLEMRSAAKVAKADAVLKETSKPAKRKKGGVSFDALKSFGEIKKLLLEATGTTEEYYAVLKANGYEHADAIEDNDKAREIYKALLLVHNRVRQEKLLQTEMELAHMQYGVDFMDLLGLHGCETIADTLTLPSEPLENLRKEIKMLGTKG